jgi:hypothetical protein
MEMPIIYESYAVTRKGRLSKTPEVQMTANKIPTQTMMYLWDENATTRLEGATVYVGTTIIIRVGVVAQGVFIGGKTINIWRKVDTGAYEIISSVSPSMPPGTYDVKMTFLKSGLYAFYAEFPGDDQYAGCLKTAKAFVR